MLVCAMLQWSLSTCSFLISSIPGKAAADLPMFWFLFGPAGDRPLLILLLLALTAMMYRLMHHGTVKRQQNCMKRGNANSKIPLLSADVRTWILSPWFSLLPVGAARPQQRFSVHLSVGRAIRTTLTALL